jgi:hypothetical protein
MINFDLFVEKNVHEFTAPLRAREETIRSSRIDIDSLM